MIAELKNLTVSFPNSQGGENRVIDNLSLTLEKGKTLALVGESGSGKSLTALALMGLLPKTATTSGEIHFANERLDQKTDRHLQKIRGSEIAMIFQEPMTALNPLHSIGRQIEEMLELHRPDLKAGSRKKRVLELLEEVGLTKMLNRLDAYPHQLSGGERQRVMIAMAIAAEPKLLLADEPTTAIDVSLRKQILTLLNELKEKRELTLLFITHDLALVEEIADRVTVLKSGKLVESQPKKAFFESPKEAYSRELLAARPAILEGSEPKGAQTMIEAKALSVQFARKKNWFGAVTKWTTVVKEVDLKIKKGTSVGLVGESGSGKTTLAMALLQLQPYQGSVIFQGDSLQKFTKKQKQALRSKLQIVFQDPFGSLNPRQSIYQVISEGLCQHRPSLSSDELRNHVEKWLVEVGLQADMADRYPHEFSGGQRQRIAIARAMILKPELVIMDEPTSALDVTMQSQIISLLLKLQKKYQTSYFFISHDLPVIRALCHKIAVMKQGEIVEMADNQTLFNHPKDPYTASLIQASLFPERSASNA
jgi:microcin C transport system ATP-binding protein